MKEDKIQNLQKMISNIEKKIEKLELQKKLYQMTLDDIKKESK